MAQVSDVGFVRSGHISNILESKNLTCSHFHLPEPSDIDFVEPETTSHAIQDEQIQVGLNMKKKFNHNQFHAFNIIAKTIYNRIARDQTFFPL